MPSDIGKLISEYRRAEEAIKDTERRLDSLCIPSVNEMRMALYHVMLQDESGAVMTPEGVEAAIKHCKRAYYDSREMETAALCNASHDILKSIKGYARVVAAAFPSYHKFKNAAIDAKETLSTAQDVRASESREAQFSSFDVHREELRNFIREYEKYSDDIQEAIWQEKIKNVLLLLGGIGVLIAIYVAILKFFC